MDEALPPPSTPPPALRRPPSISLREYPVDLGTLFLILVPMFGLFAAIASVTWSKIDKQTDQITELRVAAATTSQQLASLTTAVSKLTTIVERQTDQLTAIERRLAAIESTLVQRSSKP